MIATEFGAGAPLAKLVFELLAVVGDLSLVDRATRGWMEEYQVDPGPLGSSAPRRRIVDLTAPAIMNRQRARPATVTQPVKIDDDLYIRDYAKCILCYKCVAACGEDAQNTFAIAVAGRGFDARITTEFDVASPTQRACTAVIASAFARPER